MRRHYLTLRPTTVEEALGQSGWSLGPGGDTLIDARGNEAFFRERSDGHLEFWLAEDADGRDLLERVPCEEIGHAVA